MRDEPTGQELKEEGIARVSANNREFLKRGIQAYESFCDYHEGEYTANDIRDYMNEEPTHYGAWGALGRMAHSRGLVTELEFVPARHPSGHASRIPKYVGRLDPRWDEGPRKIYDEKCKLIANHRTGKRSSK